MQKSIYPWQKNRNRGKMLRGVVSTSVMKNPVLTKTEKQQAYVKESLTRAMQEVRMAKLNGQKLPDARDLLKVKSKKSADRIYSYRHFLFVVSDAV